MALGSWEINVQVGKMPQKVATAFGDLSNMVGAEYNMIAYLGSQVVNGTNHAVLAEQTIVAGHDVKNIVVVKFRETKEGVTLMGIEPVLSEGGELGGVKINVKTPISDEAQLAFKEVMSGFVGSDVKPFAELGTQVVKGTNYFLAGTLAPVVPDAVAKAVIIVVNLLTREVNFVNLLSDKRDVGSLGYAFTWL